MEARCERARLARYALTKGEIMWRRQPLAAARERKPQRLLHIMICWRLLQVLRDDKHEIFRAARDAHRAADLLLALELHKSLDEALSHLNEPHASMAQQPICDGAQVIHPTREKEQVALEMEL